MTLKDKTYINRYGEMTQYIAGARIFDLLRARVIYKNLLTHKDISNLKIEIL